MNEERLRWRTNPAIIAQYFTGEDLPTDIDIHLIFQMLRMRLCQIHH